MTPNLVIPLAYSYNPRGVKGADTVLVDNKDQRKVNCMYEVASNSVAGSGTPYLVKRPGATKLSGTFGASTQTPYLITLNPLATVSTDQWVIVKDGTAIKACSSAAATTILTDATLEPAYIDRPDYGGTRYAVVQIRNPVTAAAHRTFYSNAIATWTEISDASYTGLTHKGKMEHLDGFAFQMESNNRIYNSSLNSISDWPGNYIQRTSGDIPVGLIRYGGLILAFGQETVEYFYNAGNAAGSPLSRVTANDVRHQRVGLGGSAADITLRTHYYCTIGDKIYFIGKMAGGGDASNSLIMFNGSRFEKVSGVYQDKLFTTVNIYGVYSVSFQGKRFVAVQSNPPGTSPHRAWLFSPDYNEWFEFESTVFTTTNGGEYYTGLVAKDKIYYFDPAANNWADDGTNFTMTAQFQLPYQADGYKTMYYCGVVADTATATTNLGVSFADNDYVTFATARNIDLANVKKSLRRCGTYRMRAVRLTSTDNKEVRLQKFYAAVE